MGIGYHVQKYLKEKAAKTAESGAAEEPRADVAAEAVSEEQPVDESMSKSEFLQAVALLLKEIKSSDLTAEDKGRYALEAERLSLEHERLRREMPENKQAPGISVFSNPKGDRDDPKPPLKCQMFWLGYPLTTDTLTPQEVALLNQLEPGEYRVKKSDGAPIPFIVTAKHDDRFRLEKLNVWFPNTEDHKQNHGSMVSYLQQALGTHQPSADELQAELQRLQAELALAKAGVMSAI